MTSPRVIELPRRLEATAPDTFLSGDDAEAPLAVVVALRTRAPLSASARRAPRARGGARTLRAMAGYDPGDQAA